MRRHRIGNQHSDQLGRTGQQKRHKDHPVLRSNPAKNRGGFSDCHAASDTLLEEKVLIEHRGIHYSTVRLRS